MLISSIRFDISNYYANILSNISDVHSFHHTVGVRKKTSKFKRVVSVCGEDGVLVKEENNLANLFAKHFAKNSKITVNWDSSNSERVEEFVRGLRSDPGFILSKKYPALPDERENVSTDLVSLSEVQDIIATRNNKLSAGSDSMPNRLLKMLDISVLKKLTILFNQLIAVGHFPSCWKYAIVIPIPKAGRDSNKVCNWRPIYLLSCLSKLFERVIALRIQKVINAGRVIPHHQFGFRAAHSTNHALALLQNTINDNLNNRMVTTMVCLDIQAAFDTVWHEGLLFKHHELRFPRYITLLVKNFLKNRCFRVKVGNAYSNFESLLAGVPQGSVLGPLLFNIATYDIPVSEACDLIQFADDTSVSFSFRAVKGVEESINSHLELLYNWYKAWKFKINASKTQLIHFVGNCRQISPYRRKIINAMCLKINNKDLIAQKSIKYLGVIFSSNNRFNKHVDFAIAKLTTAKNSLLGLIYNQFIDTRFKKFLYTVYLRPILVYATPSNISSHQMEKCRLAERKLIRCTHNIFRARNSFKYHSNDYVYKFYDYDRVDVYITKLSIKFHSKNIISDNPLIREITKEYAVGIDSSTSLKRTDFIYNLFLSKKIIDNNNKLTLYNKATFGPIRRVYREAQSTNSFTFTL